METKKCSSCGKTLYKLEDKNRPKGAMHIPEWLHKKDSEEEEYYIFC